MKFFCMIGAVLLFAVTGMYSCGNGNGCKVTEDYFAVITNTLSTPATVVFRPFYFQIPEQNLTIDTEQTSSTFSRRIDTRRSQKTLAVNWFCGEDDYEVMQETLQFSNATLAQYTVCRSQATTYAVLASGATCTGAYPLQEEWGW